MIRRTVAVWIQCMVASSAFCLPVALSYSYRAPEPPVERVVSSLLSGHRAEIIYQVRLYLPASGLERIVGDRLVAEREVSYTARWDAVNERFIVIAEDTQEVTFSDAHMFTEFFFRLTDYLEVDAPPQEDWYMLCRCRIEPVKLVPPLTLLPLFTRNHRLHTPWERVDFTVCRL